jgi:hypothetical protein
MFSHLLGHFWVLSDSHVDLLYRPDGNPKTACRNASGTHQQTIKRTFGHHDCDAPLELLISSISNAKKIDPSVDFLIWLG